jgi:hypothetical protein
MGLLEVLLVRQSPFEVRRESIARVTSHNTIHLWIAGSG